MKDTINADFIKNFCRENSLTYKELASAIGMTEASVKTAISINRISTQTQASIRMLITIREQKNELDRIKEAVSIIKNINF